MFFGNATRKVRIWLNPAIRVLLINVKETRCRQLVHTRSRLEQLIVQVDLLMMFGAANIAPHPIDPNISEFS